MECFPRYSNKRSYRSKTTLQTQDINLMGLRRDIEGGDLLAQVWWWMMMNRRFHHQLCRALRVKTRTLNWKKYINCDSPNYNDQQLTLKGGLWSTRTGLYNLLFAQTNLLLVIVVIIAPSSFTQREIGRHTSYVIRHTPALKQLKAHCKVWSASYKSTIYCKCKHLLKPCIMHCLYCVCGVMFTLWLPHFSTAR